MRADRRDSLGDLAKLVFGNARAIEIKRFVLYLAQTMGGRRPVELIRFMNYPKRTRRTYETPKLSIEQKIFRTQLPSYYFSCITTTQK